MAENIYDVADRFRRELLARDRQAARAMIDAYGESWLRIRARVDALNAQIREAKLAGEAVNQSWLYRKNRLQTLKLQVEREIADFARLSALQIAGAEADAVDMARDHARHLALVGAGERPAVTALWTRLPREAVTDLVGFTRDGSPLADLLAELGPEAGAGVRKALISGVALGQGPREIARGIRTELGGNLVRALTISRTEVMRSYRTATLRSYGQNRDVVDGWVWHSALDTRTCPFCWSQHGREFSVNEPFATHPRCRCSPLPRTKSWADILGPEGEDIPDTRPQVKTGPDVFASLPERRQRQILGPAKFSAYQDGALKVEDLAGFRKDPKWGPVGFERSLRDILGDEEAKRYIRARAVVVSKPMPKTLVEQLESVEARIRSQRFESAYLLDSNGRIVMDKDGGRSSVSFTDAETSLFRGNVLTHNHPRGVNFSPTDIGMGLNNGLREIRAVGADYTVSMRFPADHGQRWESLDSGYLRLRNDTALSYRADVASGRLTLDQAEASVWHKVWGIMAEQNGWTYTRRLIE